MDPRVIRLRDAAKYLGMDKNRFNNGVRPYITEIPVGTQGIGFDRLDLDAWFEDYKSRNGRPGHAMERSASWGRKSHQDSSNVVESGTFRKKSANVALDAALERALSKKPNAT